MKQLVIHQAGPYKVRVVLYGTEPEQYVVEVSNEFGDARKRTWGVVSQHTTSRAAKTRFNLVVRIATTLSMPNIFTFVPPPETVPREYPPLRVVK